MKLPIIFVRRDVNVKSELSDSGDFDFLKSAFWHALLA